MAAGEMFVCVEMPIRVRKSGSFLLHTAVAGCKTGLRYSAFGVRAPAPKLPEVWEQGPAHMSLVPNTYFSSPTLVLQNER